jgi:CPA1 family monovalent cation:H+ antiporter
MLAWYVTDIDFNKTLMYGMLSFLLFAGALHTDLNTLLERRYTVVLLATGGVLLSTLLVGTVAWLILPLVGLELPWVICLVFGALISPTDPIAVLGMLRRAGAPPRLSAIIAGESLFNDGVGVVVFIVLATVAGLSGGHEAPAASTVALLFVQEVGGGVLLGLGLGLVAYHALKSIDEHILEVQITLALVMLVTVISDKLHISGPIAVVLAGLLLGNHGKRLAMSANTADHMQKFWDMIDAILNAVLFLLIGLEVFAVSLSPMNLLAGAILVPVVLGARALSVTLPVALMRRWRSFERGTVPILVWSGLRGGISVALVLSLPPFEGKDSLVTAVYVVVLFSILAQGLTVRPLVSRLLSRS